MLKLKCDLLSQQNKQNHDSNFTVKRITSAQLQSRVIQLLSYYLTISKISFEKISTQYSIAEKRVDLT